MAQKSPTKVFRVGAVSASVFVNTSTREEDGQTTDREFCSTSLQRSYKDDDGKWQYNSSLTLGDLANAIRALTLAQAYVEKREASVLG